MSYNAVKREYCSILTFHNDAFYESVADRNWITYGGLEGISFSLEKSRFNDLVKCDNTVMSIFGPNSYLENTDSMYINGNSYSISMWYNITTESMATFYSEPLSFIQLVEWHDEDDVRCTIKIAAHNPETKDICCQIAYGSDVHNFSFPVYNEPDTWNHFLYTREDNIDKIYINGICIAKIQVDLNMVNASEFLNLKVGNPYIQSDTFGIFTYMIDDFALCNDVLYRDEFDPPDRFIAWLFPEIESINELDDDDCPYKQGSMTGLKYEQYYPALISSNVLAYDAPKPITYMLFINSTYMAPDRYSFTSTLIRPNVYRNTITLLDSIDIAIASQCYFTMVVITQKVNEFHTEIRQVVASVDGQREFEIPYIKHQNTLESFILFDGSLAAVQMDRFKIKKISDTQYDLVLTNKNDHIANSGTPLTFLFLTRNSYDTTVAEDDPVVNRQISFRRLQCVVSTKGQCTLPKPKNNYGMVGYGNSSALFFINGTFMPPESFTIKKGILTMTVPEDDTLAPNSNITILIPQSTETADYDNKEYLVTGASDFDDLINIRITRPVYWQEPRNPVHQMYDKLHFYENNKVPGSNFNYVDKFHLRFKD